MLVRLSTHKSIGELQTVSEMLKSLPSPKVVGEVLMHKVRRVTPQEVHFSGTVRFFSRNSTFKRVEFDPLATTHPCENKLQDGLIDHLRNIPGVYWAKECKDGRGMVVVAVAVRMWSDACVDAVRQVWESSIQGCLPLVVLEMTPQRIFALNRTTAMRTEAVAWWAMNETRV